MAMDLEEIKAFIAKKTAEFEQRHYRKCMVCGAEKRIRAESTHEERKKKFYKFENGFLCSKCNYAVKKFKEEKAIEEALNKGKK